MLEGFILQLDEVDAMQPEIGFILQQVLEPDGRLLLTDTGEDVAPHPDFRLVATANTLGFGSDSALYASGTHVLNFSWLDRTLVRESFLAPTLGWTAGMWSCTSITCRPSRKLAYSNSGIPR